MEKLVLIVECTDDFIEDVIRKGRYDCKLLYANSHQPEVEKILELLGEEL